MYLLEHDAKQLLARHGIPVPDGRLIERGASLEAAALPPGPWMVKGQIAAGGRGKAGIVRKAATPQEIASHTQAIVGATVKGRAVESVRVERQVAGAEEAYVGLLLDAGAGGVRVIVSGEGGMEVENLPPGAVRSAVAAPDAAALSACVARLAGSMEGPKGRALADAGARLARVFLECEALLVEVNPLFVHPDGGWVAGDAKVVTGGTRRAGRRPGGRLSRRRAQGGARLRLRCGRPHRRNRPAHHRRRTLHDADRRVARRWIEALQLSRYPHRRAAR
jgi:succinyl-CoA synthetase beta subunit